MRLFKSAICLALAVTLAAPCAGPAEGQERSSTLSTRQALEMPTRELARTAFEGLADRVKEVWRPSGRATGLGLTRLAFAASPFPSGFSGICAVDRWDVEFKPVPGAIQDTVSELTDAPARASELQVTRLYKVVGPVSGAYAGGETHRLMLSICPAAGTARAFFRLQGERDMLIEGLAGVSAAIKDREAHLGKSADWVCVDSREAKATACPPANQMHILNLKSLSDLRIERCGLRRDRYCIDATFSPDGQDSGMGASLKMTGVTFNHPDRHFMGVKVDASFASADFSYRLVLYH
jgi:hypothetical protein